MNRTASLLRTPSLLAAFVAPAAAGCLLLGCHAGTPAAPDGTEIPVSCAFISRDIPAGNFDAVISATVIDKDSDVPQVGVGVYFRVTQGPGSIVNQGPVVTDNHGHAETVLLGRGVIGTDKVSVEVSSGATIAKLDISATGCFSSTNVPPIAAFTLAPTAPSVTGNTTVDVATSSDADCPGGKPDTWTVDWGDGTTPDTGRFATTTVVTHDYADTRRGMSTTISVTVVDCAGARSDPKTSTFTLT